MNPILLAFIGSISFGMTALLLKIGKVDNVYFGILIRGIISVPLLLIFSFTLIGTDFIIPWIETGLIYRLIFSSTLLLIGDILLMSIFKKKPVAIIVPIVALNPVFTSIFLIISGISEFTILLFIVLIVIMFGIILTTYENNSSIKFIDRLDFEAVIYGLSIAGIWGVKTFIDIGILKNQQVEGIGFTTIQICVITIEAFIISIFINKHSFKYFINNNYRDIKYMIAAGLIGWVLGAMATYSAFNTGDPVNINLIIGLNPLFTVIFSLILRMEQITFVKLLGIVLCIGSSIVLVLL